ncbi:CBS domain-containing protein [Candidatus Woesearchaeota archaeon]|nr:MAG: CBS domain-containing protein [Candidatus Woesearchaeota archaeon]
MVKKVIDKQAYAFQQFSLLPGLTPRTCTMSSISLETTLAGVTLGVPLLSAAMTSVTGYDLALALAKERGLPILPARMSLEEQIDIVQRIKSTEMTFVEDPITVRETATIDEALRLVEKYGHSSIPVVDRNNVFLGMFIHSEYLARGIPVNENITTAMLYDPVVLCVQNPAISVDETVALLEKEKQPHLVVLDENRRLVKLAFKKDKEKLKVGLAITTHAGWQNRVRAGHQAGVDLFVIDSSDGFTEFQGDVLDEYKKMKIPVPICAGNVITYDGAMYLMEKGADMIKVGMSPGSTCTTFREKSTGRGSMTALLEVDRARNDFLKKNASLLYVPVIADGGIPGSAEMIIALTVADALMLGGYFNRFFEAAGEKINDRGGITLHDDDIAYVASWGEGSIRARNLGRYGHGGFVTFFAEGEEGRVPYAGRLKPNLKRDILKIKSAMANAGAMNLQEFRKKAVIELNSDGAGYINRNPHGLVK